MIPCSRPSLLGVALIGAVFHGNLLVSQLSAITPPEGARRDAGVRADSSEASLEARVDRVVEPYLATGNFSGSVLVARKGKILLSKGYGFSDRKKQVPNGPQTVFHLASVSRIFTSAAIMLLEQKGKLSVDDTLSTHLPDWPRGDEITIHHLLTLSAGFPNINSLPGYGAWSKSPQTAASLCEKFRDLSLEFPPGTRSVHSNSNYNALALLIEKCSGLTYGEFLTRELFAPLGMIQTAHDDHSERAVPHEAIGYIPVGLAEMEVMETPDWSVKTGNGSIYSTTKDLYRFDRMLANRTLLDGASITKLFKQHFPLHGYGWFVRDNPDTKLVSISGRSPGFAAAWVRSVDPDVTVIVLGNMYNNVPYEINRDLRAMTHDEPVDPRPLSPDPPSPSLLADIIGSYKFGPEFYRPDGTVRFHVKDGHLFDGSSAWMIPAGGMNFVHRVYWSDLKFRRDASGKVVDLKYDNFVGVRKE